MHKHFLKHLGAQWHRQGLLPAEATPSEATSQNSSYFIFVVATKCTARHLASPTGTPLHPHMQLPDDVQAQGCFVTVPRRGSGLAPTPLRPGAPGAKRRQKSRKRECCWRGRRPGTAAPMCRARRPQPGHVAPARPARRLSGRWPGGPGREPRAQSWAPVGGERGRGAAGRGGPVSRVTGGRDGGGGGAAARPALNEGRPPERPPPRGRWGPPPPPPGARSRIAGPGQARLRLLPALPLGSPSRFALLSAPAPLPSVRGTPQPWGLPRLPLTGLPGWPREREARSRPVCVSARLVRALSGAEGEGGAGEAWIDGRVDREGWHSVEEDGGTCTHLLSELAGLRLCWCFSGPCGAALLGVT